ncbi:monovalent cation/H(+) antiporter subunit G [Novispirillum sp. DQ9]|uniref:monovalent cation/H(+) antiporter subunit G n=1 Tax=Novispirillum sp. DQ9 TaxID=3398612 RepID=UPI003C7AC335
MSQPTTGYLILDLLVAALLVGGGLFCAVAGLGTLRMQDVIQRCHAATKAGTLGVALIVLAVALYFEDVGVTTRAIAIFAFLLLTAPVGAHMIGRAAYRTGVPLWDKTELDELGGRYPLNKAGKGKAGKDL